jgi:hypothetical protein
VPAQCNSGVSVAADQQLNIVYTIVTAATAVVGVEKNLDRIIIEQSGGPGFSRDVRIVGYIDKQIQILRIPGGLPLGGQVATTGRGVSCC